MPTLPNMGLVTPVLGADSGNWDDKINACFALTDAHDHTEGKGVAITVAAMDIDDDIPMGGFGLVNVGTVAFSAVTALTSGSKSLFVSSADNELYWRTNSGTNVKLTDGASINTTLVGGIVGDYSSVGAEVAYSDADQVYTFKDQESPTKKWARLASGPVRIYQFDTTESVYVEHAVDAALASSYTVTWPAALPGSTALMQISSAGVVSYSNTIVESVTIPTGKTITLAGTADIKHSTRRATVPLHLMASSTSMGAVADVPYAVTSSGTPWDYRSMSLSSVGLREGDKVTKVRLRFSGNDGSQVNLYVFHYRYDTGDATTTSNSTSASGYIEVVPGSGKNTIEEHDTMLDVMSVSVDGSSATPVTMQMEVYWERP